MTGDAISLAARIQSLAPRGLGRRRGSDSTADPSSVRLSRPGRGDAQGRRPSDPGLGSPSGRRAERRAERPSVGDGRAGRRARAAARAVRSNDPGACPDAGDPHGSAGDRQEPPGPRVRRLGRQMRGWSGVAVFPTATGSPSGPWPRSSSPTPGSSTATRPRRSRRRRAVDWIHASVERRTRRRRQVLLSSIGIGLGVGSARRPGAGVARRAIACGLAAVLRVDLVRPARSSRSSRTSTGRRRACSTCSSPWPARCRVRSSSSARRGRSSGSGGRAGVRRSRTRTRWRWRRSPAPTGSS